MTNRYLLGAGVALAVVFGGAQANAQWWPTGAPGFWYIGPEGGWTKLTNQTDTTLGPNSPALTVRSLPFLMLLRLQISTAASMPAPAAATSGGRGAWKKSTATGVTR